MKKQRMERGFFLFNHSHNTVKTNITNSASRKDSELVLRPLEFIIE